MITIKVCCSMCGNTEPLRMELELESMSIDGIRELIESAGWIVQINGTNMDAYCCQRCAE